MRAHRMAVVVAGVVEHQHRRFVGGQRLDALATELARGKRERRAAHIADAAATSTPTTDDNDNDID